MKQNKSSPKVGPLRIYLESKGLDGLSVVLILCAFVAGLVLLLFLGPGAAFSKGIADGIQVGALSEKDVYADRDISYVDEKATALRIDAEEKLVLPVFVIDEKIGGTALERFREFQDLLLALSSKPYAPDSLYLQVQSAYPGLLDKKEIIAIAAFGHHAQIFSNADAVLRRLFEVGIAAIPQSGLESYNSDYIELRRLKAGRYEEEEIPKGKILSMADIDAAIDVEIVARRLSGPLASHVAALVKCFVAENAFFDAVESRRRLEITKLRVDPIVRTIARGEHLIRKGFLVTENDLYRLSAAIASDSRADWGRLIGQIGLYALLFAISIFLLGREISGLVLGRSELLLALSGFLIYFAGAITIVRFAALPESLYVAILLPGALFTLLLAILVGQRFALLYGLALSIGVLVATGLDSQPFILAFIAAEAGAFTVRKASSRIELVRASAFLALIEGLSAAIVAAPGAKDILGILGPAVGGGANGFLCGALSLALLPVIEQALNAPTRFRLMELSDLNAPILKRLLTVAPGTYSHSVTVAHLAESACREIGADPLLARVGAYYHDIGKIEQPDYFVENQAGYNKHDEINPRLSATVIRSHVKLGVEKARALGLPSAIVAIIGEHHGNSRISYFYNQALKDDPEAKAEDFSYPGQTPQTREAAVVMLADLVEAATRTLKRPTLARLEDFIKELVMEKVRQGQLDHSDLTFKDLETIQGSFARILAGHFHSRIEYPKLKDQPR